VVLVRLCSSTASAIGTGKYSTSCSTAISSVLITACQNDGSANIRVKLSNPTQGLAQMPMNGA
jgi:hypothetical protein